MDPDVRAAAGDPLPQSMHPLLAAARGHEVRGLRAYGDVAGAADVIAQPAISADLSEARRLLGAGLRLVKMKDFTKQPEGMQWNEHPVTSIDLSATGYGLLLAQNKLCSIDPDNGEVARVGMAALGFDLEALMEAGVRTRSTRPGSGGRSTFAADGEIGRLVFKCAKFGTVIEFRAEQSNLQDTVPGIVYRDKAGNLCRQQYANSKRLDDPPPLTDELLEWWERCSTDLEFLNAQEQKFFAAVAVSCREPTTVIKPLPSISTSKGDTRKLAFPARGIRGLYNRKHTVPSILERHGYTYHAKLKRWSCPTATGAPGIHQVKDRKGKELEGLWSSDHASDALHGRFDAWVAHVVLDHGSDLAAAIAANPLPPPPEPPQMPEDDPGYSDADDGGELLRDMAERGERRTGAQGQSEEASQRVRLADVCVTEKESSRFQQAASAPREAVAQPDDTEPAGTSDDDLAQEFTRQHGDRARYIAAWGKWLLWDGRRWLTDDRLEAFSMARRICRDVLAKLLPDADSDGKQARLRQRLGSAQTIAAVLKIAASDPAHALAVDQLDADPWVLNTPGGLLDLRTGALRPHDPGAHCTKIAAAAPSTECPAFLRTLERVIPDPEVRDYLQRLAGYALVGAVRDHVLPFWYGSGRNGKSVLANALRHAMGDYACVLPAEVLVESHNDRHPTEIAALRGVRLAVASEVDSGRRWNESRLKRLTGGDPISARYIGRDPFEFEPSHLLLVIANAKPGLRVIDDAIRGRIHLTQFGVVIPEAERDTTLGERLTAEAGGILTWALAGCLDWLSAGLRPPGAVLEATGAYFDSEDSIAQWIAECCRPAGQVTVSAAHRAYKDWCEKNDMPALGRNTLGDQLEARGYRRTEIRKRHFVISGLSLPVREDARYSDA